MESRFKLALVKPHDYSRDKLRNANSRGTVPIWELSRHFLYFLVLNLHRHLALAEDSDYDVTVAQGQL